MLDKFLIILFLIVMGIHSVNAQQTETIAIESLKDDAHLQPEQIFNYTYFVINKGEIKKDLNL